MFARTDLSVAAGNVPVGDWVLPAGFAKIAVDQTAFVSGLAVSIFYLGWVRVSGIRMVFGVVLMAAWVAGCRPSGMSPSDQIKKKRAEHLVVIAVNEPLRYFAQTIGGDLVTVKCPVPAPVRPDAWKPNADDINIMQTADLVLLNGGGYSPWLMTVSLPENRKLVTGEVFSQRWIRVNEGFRHRHGPQGAVAGDQVLPTFWLDPNLALLQAEAVYNAIRKRIPDQTERLRENFDALKKNLEDLDHQAKRSFGEAKRPTILFASEEFRYLTRQYSIAAEFVNLDSTRVPKGEELVRVEKKLAEYAGGTLFWTLAPSKEVEAWLTESYQLHSITLYRGDQPADDLDWLAQMKENLNRLQTGSKQ